MNIHEHFMQRCIQLAQKGLGAVAPNPLVGAVLVHEKQIIAEGWHREFGKPHAEVNCLQSVAEEQMILIPESTLYVSLEPCNHFGKTPPCTHSILESKIKKVVVGSVDPNSLVSGSGIKKLRSENVEVVEGVLKNECEELNRRFFTYHKKNRPYVILKIAQSADGFMAPESGEQLWLTNDFSKRLSHRWRTEEQAILVGTNTAFVDNPQLTARLWQGRQPLRVLIDRQLRVPETHHIFSDSALTLVFNELRQETKLHITYQKIDFASGALRRIMEELHNRKIQSLIVEGGARTIQKFLDEKMWDEIRLITAPVKLDGGLKTPIFEGQMTERFMSGNDEVKIFRNW